ncbi:superoxide dismutase [Anaerobacillus alkaliphilus]|uniref:superoxide dismutase n=1 Tax=Anaerobacillus alkaliphilus TaxID=1548597 RepID=A0A4Q0VWX5_9BACI|nr:superoxide dismutase [Anaerobacillus alkaliphilus]RXJ03862.1 superoxide dismutase [Anaerobacillus alkaliphilus]
MDYTLKKQYIDELLNWARQVKDNVRGSTIQEKLINFEDSLLSVHDLSVSIPGEEISRLSERANELYQELNRHLIDDNCAMQRKEVSKRVPIGQHKLPPLPYAYNALQPYIDEEIMRLHHAEHHKSYVDGLNKAEKEMEKARKNDDFDLLKHWEREAAFHGAGHYLHTIFWNVMSPKGGGTPKGSLAEQINLDFGSFDLFKKHFSNAAKKVEAVGWAILVWAPRAGRLEILQAEKHQNLSQWDVIPILPLDVWEHAYYLQYKNKRDLYVDNWWNVVNWDHVSSRFEKAQKVKWETY